MSRAIFPIVIATVVAAMPVAALSVPADSSPQTDPQTLPGLPQLKSEAGKDYRLRDFTAKDAAGKPLGMPAQVIEMSYGDGEWTSLDSKDIPAFTDELPEEMRSRLQLFYTPGLGWVLVPRGWKVQRAAEGEDTTGRFTFVAPTGAKDGWLITDVVPACMGCMYMDTDGLLPSSHQRLIDMDIAEPGSKPAQVIPTPDSMSHPNPCTAVFSYHKPPSPPVQAVVFLGEETPDSDAGEQTLYLALPEKDSKLAEFLITRFRQHVTSCAVEAHH